MPREVKELMLRELQERFQDIQQTGCVLVDYQGVRADETRRLRAEIKREGAEMTVVKNSIFALAMANLGAAGLAELLNGPIAVVRGANPVAAAKAARQMTKANEAVQVRGAYCEGRVVGPERVAQLADIPGREELLGMVAGALTSPLRRLAAGLLTRQRELLSVLTQLRDGKQQSPEGGQEPDNR
jgi:large subunit ribosomal protein L10